jgi:hypothetical protein
MAKTLKKHEYSNNRKTPVAIKDRLPQDRSNNHNRMR